MATKKTQSKAKTSKDKKSTENSNVTQITTAPIEAVIEHTLKHTENVMSKQPFQFDKIATETANQGRESMEAFVKSGTIFAKGFEDIMKATAAMTQSVSEKQAEFTKQLMGSKTLNEFTEAQNKIAQSSFDQFMSGATQITEMSVKMLSEASEPINAQMSAAVQKANKAMAA